MDSLNTLSTCANICRSDDRTEALKTSGFSDGLCFTDRPLEVGEKLVLKFSGKGWPRGTRFGVTRTDPRLLHRFLPQFVHSGYDAHTGILGGDYLGVLDVPGLDLAKDLEMYFEAVNGKLMIQNGNCEPQERVKGIRRRQPIYVVFDIARQNVRIQIRPEVVPQPEAVVADTQPLVKLLSRNFERLHLTPAYFTTTIPTDVTVRPHLAMNRTVSPTEQSFAIVETPLKANSTIIVEILELKGIGPLGIVLTIESAEEVLSYGSLLDLCENTYSVMMECKNAKSGDELAIRMSPKGVINISLSNRRWISRMHVDPSLEYHIVFSMANISVLSMVGMATAPESVQCNANAVVAQKPSKPRGAGLSECVICFENARDVVVIPCYHFVLCAGCAHSLRRSTEAKCPLCRGGITAVRKIYMS